MVGLIAVAGGSVMVVYLDEAFARYMREGRIHAPAGVDAAVVEGRVGTRPSAADDRRHDGVGPRGRITV